MCDFFDLSEQKIHTDTHKHTNTHTNMYDKNQSDQNQFLKN